MNEKSTKSSIVFSDHWLEDEVVFGLRASTTVLNLKLDVPSDFSRTFRHPCLLGTSCFPTAFFSDLDNFKLQCTGR